LFQAVLGHEQIDLIEQSEHEALSRTRDLLDEMIRRARRAGVAQLLRFAVETSEYEIIASATFDGAQRLANLQKLFTLAERFERSGAYLIRDFVRFVQDFEEAGGRESEGLVDDSADAVRLMSIHQSKGLEFPVVIIPDLHRLPENRRDWWALDRHLGLTSKVADGRGRLLGGWTFTTFAERAKRREEFESMRLLYVAATRARDRLILSGAAKDLGSLKNSWLGWVCKACGVTSDTVSGALSPSDGVDLRLTLNLLDSARETDPDHNATVHPVLEPPEGEDFPLLRPIESKSLGDALHRFSVTQLLNYRRCPRQYFFDRVLRVPDEDEIAVWNDAEAPEPPSNLTATLRGAVMHRFCEKFVTGGDLYEGLRGSFEEVSASRSIELGARISEIDAEKALRDLLPLAKNYVGSKVRDRIESARALTNNATFITHTSRGVFSEQRFRLRRPLGILTGTIDKLLILPARDGERVNVEIIDFKTNRIRGKRGLGKLEPVGQGQLSFDFSLQSLDEDSGKTLLIQSEIEEIALEYRVQMQAYALAARDLIDSVESIRVTLHFLDADMEVCLPENLLQRDACASAIDQTMEAIVSSSSPESFKACPAEHCRFCSFVDLCLPGREFLGRG
jgi:ATP-dependent helicase/nuclease subunit A